jgi:hypothetical protein
LWQKVKSLDATEIQKETFCKKKRKEKKEGPDYPAAPHG